MDTLIFDADTTGADVVERLTDAERDCIQAALGDDYGLLAVTPLGAMSEVGVDAGLYDCLTQEHLLSVGIAVIGLRFGGRTPETNECIREVYRLKPKVLYELFDLESEGPSASPDEVSRVAQGMVQCMTSGERTNFIFGMWDRMSTVTTDRGRDFVALLSADEILCANEAIGQEAAEEVLDQNPITVWRSYPAVHDCFSPATKGVLFTQLTANLVGGVVDSSRQCLEDLASQRPDFVTAIANGRSADSFEEDVDVNQFVLDSAAVFSCFTLEERGRLQRTLQ